MSEYRMRLKHGMDQGQLCFEPVSIKADTSAHEGVSSASGLKSPRASVLGLEEVVGSNQIVSMHTFWHEYSVVQPRSHPFICTFQPIVSAVRCGIGSRVAHTSSHRTHTSVATRALPVCSPNCSRCCSGRGGGCGCWSVADDPCASPQAARCVGCMPCDLKFVFEDALHMWCMLD
eukprot:1162080-Pelagomonas_calceolata.AAC.12